MFSRLCNLLALVLVVLHPVVGRKVYSIADLHGDYPAAVKALQLARLLGDDQRTWIGGDKILVQTGDIVDRGDNAREIYQLLFHLQDQAALEGGQVVLLLGNHEQLRLENDARYILQYETGWTKTATYTETLPMVDMTQLSKCDSWPDAWHFNCYYGHGQGEVGVLDITPAIPGQGGLRSASHAGRHHPDDVNTWGPDGWLTKELRKRTQIMVVIGNVLYAHATVTQAYLVGRMLETAKKLVEEANASDGFFEHAEREARLLPWIGAQLPSDEDMSDYALNFTVPLNAPTHPDGTSNPTAATVFTPTSAPKIRTLNRDQVDSLLLELNDLTWDGWNQGFYYGNRGLANSWNSSVDYLLAGEGSPLWERNYADNCRASTRLFSFLGVAMEIGGHHPGPTARHGKVHQMCAGRSVIADTGMGRGYRTACPHSNIAVLVQDLEESLSKSTAVVSALYEEMTDLSRAQKLLPAKPLVEPPRIVPFSEEEYAKLKTEEDQSPPTFRGADHDVMSDVEMVAPEPRRTETPRVGLTQSDLDLLRYYVGAGVADGAPPLDGHGLHHVVPHGLLAMGDVVEAASTNGPWSSDDGSWPSPSSGGINNAGAGHSGGHSVDAGAGHSGGHSSVDAGAGHSGGHSVGSSSSSAPSSSSSAPSSTDSAPPSTAVPDPVAAVFLLRKQQYDNRKQAEQEAQEKANRWAPCSCCNAGTGLIKLVQGENTKRRRDPWENLESAGNL